MGTKPCKSAAGMKSAFAPSAMVWASSLCPPNALQRLSCLQYPEVSRTFRRKTSGLLWLYILEFASALSPRLRERPKTVSQASPWPSSPCQRKNPRTDLYMHARMRLKTRPGPRKEREISASCKRSCLREERSPASAAQSPALARRRLSVWNFGVNPTNFLRPYAHSPAEEAACSRWGREAASG